MTQKEGKKVQKMELVTVSCLTDNKLWLKVGIYRIFDKFSPF